MYCNDKNINEQLFTVQYEHFTFYCVNRFDAGDILENSLKVTKRGEQSTQNRSGKSC